MVLFTCFRKWILHKSLVLALSGSPDGATLNDVYFAIFSATAQAHYISYANAQVLGISHLSRDLKNCDEFIACGREALPLEMQQQQQQHQQDATPRRRRTQTPYHAPALQGINTNDSNEANNRPKKGPKQLPSDAIRFGSITFI